MISGGALSQAAKRLNDIRGIHVILQLREALALRLCVEGTSPLEMRCMEPHIRFTVVEGQHLTQAKAKVLTLSPNPQQSPRTIVSEAGAPLAGVLSPTLLPTF
jgi:hypothetical protein